MPWCSGAFGGAFLRDPFGVDHRAQKAQLALYSAAGLPIIVAVTEVATSSGLLEESTASLLVAGGALTVLLFPLWALGIRQAFGDAEPVQEAPSRKRADECSEGSA